ncbi:methyl-accepting chemotaxis protein [Phytohalomonas tamaricis]|uniref:methyl-accepting chemotaxis protein n=1 Tax=Phytohalomonas tamaricis TaxID=2081032 RepID=UPI000D0BA077|nr:methyl-accepting chemotaxis protein [Phytohalomonas tamaricis]
MSIQWTIAKKLALVMSLCAFLLIAVGVIGLASLSRSNSDIKQIHQGNIGPLVALPQAMFGQEEIVNEFTSAIDRNDITALKAALGHLSQLRQVIDNAWSNYYPEGISTDEEKKIADKYIEQAAARTAALNQLSEAAAAGNIIEAQQILTNNMMPAYHVSSLMFNQLIELNAAQVERRYQRALNTYHTVKWSVIAGIGFGLTIMVAVVVMLNRTIAQPLRHAAWVADAISNGNLDHRLKAKSKDELGSLFSSLDQMCIKLREIMSGVLMSSNEVSAAARELSMGNNELSNRTQQQAASLEETAASMEEMTSTVKQNANHADQADQLVRVVERQAEEGGKIVEQSIAAITEINASSQKISEITSMIDEIAFQTNLLSLNAAVEAARAGEQGRGFAVVASEVRNLAQRSAVAAKDIKLLVQDSILKVEDGSRLVNHSGKSLEEVVQGVRRMAALVTEIASAGREQFAGIDQVNTAVVQMDSVTQQNAGMVEEAAAASKSLEEQAEHLQRQVGFFKFNQAGTPTAEPYMLSSVARSTETLPQPSYSQYIISRQLGTAA